MSKRAIFDHPDTCPKIDRAKGEAGAELERVLDSLLDEACPLLDDGIHRRQMLDDWLHRAFEAVEGAFETVRDTNEVMRRAAEYQIEGMAAELDEKEAEIDSLESRIHDLECSHA
jgi:hypothetical protein